MIYLICEAENLELPLAVADSLTEISEICGRHKASICRSIKHGSRIMAFGTYAKAYEIEVEE